MKNFFLKKLPVYLLTLGWMGLIFYFSSQNASLSTDTSNSFTALILRFVGITPTTELLEGLRSIIRTSAHFCIFGILALFFYWSCAVSKNKKHLFALPLTFSISYAVIDEIHQLFSDGRAFQFIDIIIDTAGAAVFLCIPLIINFISQKKKRKIK